MALFTNIHTFAPSINQNLMKKQYSILSLALSLFFFSVVVSSNAQPGSKSDVSVSRSVSAAQMAADGRPMVVVTVTIKKFAFTGPGKIEEDFSSDFQASVISNGRAVFQTGGGKAYFIWNNIQKDRVITVSYALEAMGKTGNSQTISGQFFYQNQSFPIASSSFTIDASNLPAYVAPVQDYSPLDDVFYAVSGTNLDGSTRPTPGAAMPATTMPASNSMASNMNSGQHAPSTTTAPMQTSSSTPAVNSSAPMQIQSSSANTAPAQQSVPVATTPVASSNPTPDNSSANQQSSTANNSSSQQNNAGNNNSSAANNTPPQQNTPVANTASQQSSSNNGSSGNNSSPAASSGPAGVGAASAPGLVYHVQIIVVGDKSRLSDFLRHYNISDQPVYDPADGTPVRVMVGNYDNYNAAKARATELKNKGIAGAFVAPYYNGQRITIADAASHTAH